MFERNRVDHSGAAERTGHLTKLVLKDGTELAGRILAPVTRSLGDELNGTGNFLVFEGFDGLRQYLAKDAVFTVEPMAVPGAEQLTSNVRRLEGFDPYAILGVEPGAEREMVKHAYRQMAKTYHPDRFAGLDLPGEVTDYLSAVARRINAAYSVLEKTMVRPQPAPAAATVSPIRRPTGPRSEFGRQGSPGGV